MESYNVILARQLGCEPAGVVDYLFPKEKGFTEQERLRNIVAIYVAMDSMRNHKRL